MENEIMEFGERLQRERKKAGFTQKELADKLHVSHQAVAKWEQSMSEPSMQALIELSEIFGVDLDYLIKGEVRQEKEVPQVLPQIVPAPIRPRRSNKFIKNLVFFILSSVGILGMLTFTVVSDLLERFPGVPWFVWFIPNLYYPVPLLFSLVFLLFVILFIVSFVKLLKENKKE